MECNGARQRLRQSRSTHVGSPTQKIAVSLKPSPPPPTHTHYRHYDALKAGGTASDFKCKQHNHATAHRALLINTGEGQGARSFAPSCYASHRNSWMRPSPPSSRTSKPSAGSPGAVEGRARAYGVVNLTCVNGPELQDEETHGARSTASEGGVGCVWKWRGEGMVRGGDV